VTGSGRDAFGFPDQVQILNELISLALGIVHLYPTARSVIEIGAESSRGCSLARLLPQTHTRKSWTSQ
jgi:activator of 2-hydroxyglutaryl-CoA dehydratase